ncbi:TIGR03084 family metal-binding protein [Actinokineospora bangkokensis]|uniref:TIGR03084 family protein n=1 Tax=Actinokineospora bangkokensis TaxID=1193682 RepID=A0A1Q9LSJ5_9PSEU|nr:TIGR03084 family metal-binding protein [Actinokineospora bangkokensis]OLR95012.1 TIGR03084 family protein [Actinokineospora bangkokensis]
MVELSSVLADLRAEGDELESWVVGLPPDRWRAATPAEGWTVAHQVAHLAWTDERALLATTDPEGFQEEIRTLAARSPDPQRFVDQGAQDGAALAPDQLLQRWRDLRTSLHDALAATPADARLAWYGPPMSPMSMATARLMETWAHSLDVADGLGVEKPVTGRIRHVAHLGVRTRDFAYLLRGLPVPQEPFRVELAAPGGGTWAWGPEDAGSRVSGPALDFCLLVTQRVHRADTALVATGEAEQWLGIAQAFAGPPGKGRPQR